MIDLNREIILIAKFSQSTSIFGCTSSENVTTECLQKQRSLAIQTVRITGNSTSVQIDFQVSKGQLMQ